MSVAEPEQVERKELIEFRKQDAAIAKLAEQYMPLVINGINDKAGYKAVHDARMIVKDARIKIEKTRKALKEEALRYGQAVDAEAKRLTTMLAPVEAHLTEQESAIDAEKERIKQAAENARRAMVQQRLEALAAVGYVGNPIEVAEWTQPKFDAELVKATAEHVERQKAAEAAAEAERLERERLAAERREIERIQAEQRAAQEKIEAEKRAIELEKARIEAAEKARIETEQRMIREAELKEQRRIAAEQEAARKREQEAAEAEAKRQAEIAAKKRAEELRPYKEKLRILADQLRSIEPPEGPTSDEVREILDRAADSVDRLAS